MISDNLDELVFLLPVIVGGCLTIVGGIVSNSFLNSRTIKHENRVVYRDKLEEIYMLAYSVFVKSSNLTSSNSKLLEDYDILQLDLHRIHMLIRLYHPWLKEKFDIVMVNYEKCSSKSCIESELSDRIKIHDDLSKSIFSFQNSIQNGFQKYV